MADSYEELVELGFEGVDKFATKFHDPCHDFIGKRRPHWHNRKGKQEKEKDQASPPPRAHSEVAEDQDRGPPREENKNDMYSQAPDRRRDRSWGDDGRREDVRKDDRYAETRDRGFNDAPPGTVALRGQDPYAYPGGYQVAPLVPRPPPFGYAPRPFDPPYGDRFAPDRRRPLPPRRRSSSYSPPRRQELRRSFSPPRQRRRSKSPNHHRVAATLVGALAGGAIGNASDKSSKWATIAGAVVGGLGGRELDKAYDRRKDREVDEDERRDRRRSERGRR